MFAQTNVFRVPTLEPIASNDPVAVKLLDDYFASRALGFTTHSGGYRIAHPDPAAFVPPQGLFLVLRDDDEQPVGCGGIRHIDDVDGAVTYEVKHVWIDEQSRGRGWSRLLMAELEDRAEQFGAEYLVLDTNESLVEAQSLYRSLGYELIEPYNDNPNATHWFGKYMGVVRKADA